MVVTEGQLICFPFSMIGHNVWPPNIHSRPLELYPLYKCRARHLVFSKVAVSQVWHDTISTTWHWQNTLLAEQGCWQNKAVGRTRLLAEHVVGRTRLSAEQGCRQNTTVSRIVFRAMSDLNQRQQRHNMSSAIYHRHNRIAALQERHNINTGNGCAAIAQVPQYLAENHKRAGVIAVQPSCLHVQQYGNDHAVWQCRHGCGHRHLPLTYWPVAARLWWLCK